MKASQSEGTSRRDVPILDGLSQCAEAYDGFIVDLWGVMHDGVSAFPPAVACLEQLKAAGKAVAILSNAPRRSAVVVERNTALGISPELCDYVLSSGEVAWRHLSNRQDHWYGALGERCYHLGPDRDQGMRDGLEYEFVSDIAAADFILLTGPLGMNDRVEDYRDLLTAARTLNLPMVCANPDLEVVRGGHREICAGAIAHYYEELGGDVRSHGKPDTEVYELCLAGLKLAPEQAVLMIGDSLRTDIAGAQAAGIDGLFVAGGIHGELLGLGEAPRLDRARLLAFCQERERFPTAAMAALVW